MTSNRLDIQRILLTLDGMLGKPVGFEFKEWRDLPPLQKSKNAHHLRNFLRRNNLPLRPTPSFREWPLKPTKELLEWRDSILAFIDSKNIAISVNEKGRPSNMPKDDDPPSDVIDGNVRVITKIFKSRPPSEADMLEAFQIDTEQWIVADRMVINTWTCSAFVRTGTNGVWSQVDNFQVKMTLVRRHPIEVEPAIVSPVRFNNLPVRERVAESSKDKGCERALILADQHIGFLEKWNAEDLTPFHDREAMDLTVQVAAAERPDIIILVGDMLDLPDWSTKFTRSPDILRVHTQTTMYEAAWYLGRLRMASPNSRIVYMKGNHEARIEKAIYELLPQAYGLRQVAGLKIQPRPVLSIPHILGLDDIGVEWVEDYPDGSVWLNDEVEVIHGTKGNADSVSSVNRIINSARWSLVCGHVHRGGINYATTFPSNRESRMIQVVTVPCLCHTDGRVPAQKKNVNWQQGFVLADYDRSKGLFQPYMVPIKKGRCYWDGREWTGRFNKEALYEATGWNAFRK